MNQKEVTIALDGMGGDFAPYNNIKGALIASKQSNVNILLVGNPNILKREIENQKQLSSKTDIGWGHQIRSYVLQPYQLVKDLRNKVENTNPSDVLNGNIDQFIEAGIINK